MIRPAALRSTRQLAKLSHPATLPSTRFFSISLRSRAEGDTGSPRSGGTAQQDAFSKREKANEDYFVREQEMKKLKALREKLKEQEQNISNLKGDIEKIISEGGEGKK